MPTIVLPKGLIKILVAAIAGLHLAHLATQVLKYHFGHNYQAGLERLFNLDGENNIPSWYASSALLLCSAFLWLIWQLRQQQADRDARYWMALSLIFLFLSIDEAASIHETLVYHSVLYLLPSLDATGYLLYPWVLAGGAFALIVAFSCLRFLFRLPSKTRWRFVLSGLIYVGGAVGLDLLEGEFEYQHEGREQFPYALLVAVEESLEMLGILLFLYSLYEFMTAAHPAFQVTTRPAVLEDECARSRSTVVHMPCPPVVPPEPVPAKEVAL
jgi:uncharacterized membrane protein YhdT